MEFRPHPYYLMTSLLAYIIAQVMMFYYSGDIADALGTNTSIVRFLIILSCVGVPWLIIRIRREWKKESYAITRRGVSKLREGRPVKNASLSWEQVVSAKCSVGHIHLKGEAERNSPRSLKEVWIPLTLERLELLFAVLATSLSGRISAPTHVRSRVGPLLGQSLGGILILGTAIAWLFLPAPAVLTWCFFAFLTLGFLYYILYKGLFELPLKIQAYADEIQISMVAGIQRIANKDIASINVEFYEEQRSHAPEIGFQILLNSGKAIDLSTMDQLQTLIMLLAHLPASIPFHFTDSVGN